MAQYASRELVRGMAGAVMMLSCNRPRPGRDEHSQAPARLRGVDDGCQARKRPVARQGHTDFALTHTPAMDACGPSNPIAAEKNATSIPPAHHHQGKDFRALGFGWNRGTGLEPRRYRRNTLKPLRELETGTMEPWNRQRPIHIRSRAHTRICTFHGSTVPERYIDRENQSLSLAAQAVPARFHGSRINNGGNNGWQA